MMKKYLSVLCIGLLASGLTSCGLFEDKLETLDRRVHELYKADNYAAATTAAEEALKETERRFIKQKPEELIVPLNNLAGLYRIENRLEDAAATYRRMLDIYDARGAVDADRAMTAHDLAAVSLQLRSFEAAERYEKEALRYREQYVVREGREAVELAPTLNNLGYVYLVQRKYSEAEPLLLRAAKLVEKGLGPNHPNLEITRTHLAELYRLQKRTDEAARFQQDLIDARVARDGSLSPQIARAWNNLGVIFKEGGRLGEAEAAFEKAFKFFEEEPTRYASDLDIVRRNYLETLALNGKKAEVKPAPKK